MGTLYLIRHGQASYGEPDYDRLSARGHDQARAVGQWLARIRPHAIYCGPLRRQTETLETARQVANAAGDHLPLARPLPELAEYPAFEMLARLAPRLAAEDPAFHQLASAPTPALLDQAFHAILPRWASDEWSEPGLERASAFVARVRGALERVRADAPSGARIACITSAGPIGVGVGLTFGVSDARMVRASTVVKNASITELRFRSRPRTTDPAAGVSWTPDQISLVTFNLTGHLPDDLQTER